MSYGVKAAERLAGKTVLLTGASSGIGEATAQELASAANGNIRLILAARRLDRLDALKASLEKKWPNKITVLASQLDVSEYRRIPEYVKSLPKAWSQIDVLVNNAGLALGRESIGQLDIQDIEQVYFTNILGLMALTNAIVPQFRERGSGDVVFIGSIAGIEPYPGGGIYCSSKAALRSFSESLRRETIDVPGLRVIEVDPGNVETEFSVVRFRGDKSKAAGVYSGTEPLLPEDIAEVIVFALTRRTNAVLARSLVFPSHQAGSAYIHRN